MKTCLLESYISNFMIIKSCFPCGCFLWEHFKSKVSISKPNGLDELQRIIKVKANLLFEDNILITRATAW